MQHVVEIAEFTADPTIGDCEGQQSNERCNEIVEQRNASNTKHLKEEQLGSSSSSCSLSHPEDAQSLREERGEEDSNE